MGVCFYKISRLAYLAVFAVFFCGQHALAENVVCVNEPGGEIVAQVQDMVHGVKYEVGFWDIGGGNSPVASLPVTSEDDQPFATVRWKKPIEGIYQARLKKGGVWAPLANAEPLILPDIGFSLITGDLDRHSGRTMFRLPASGLFRVVGLTENTMHVAHLRGWHFGGGGESYAVDWDFLDDSKTHSHKETPGLFVVMDFIPLPPGYVVVGFPSFDRYRDAGLNRNVHVPELSLRARLSFMRRGESGSMEDIPRGSQAIRGGDFARVELDPESLKALAGRRYEIVYFINGEFIHEEAQGVSPAIWKIPSIEHLAGEAYLTVNIRDFFGSVGAVTQSISYNPVSKK